jgi:UDPglucose 6-dehydrogenase
MNKKLKLGFIGQGWIGKNYADYYEDQGFEIVRYALEEEYKHNEKKIKDCDIVFIAVPTPTKKQDFDDTILKEVLTKVGDNKIAVIKSTVLPGTTERMQQLYPDKIIVHSPEFLTEKTAQFDAVHPKRNIVGYVDERGQVAAREVIKIFPSAPYQAILPAKEAELIKYAGNCWFYLKVVYINMLYDLAQQLDIDYELVKEALSYDTRIGHTHLDPVHKSGRGAAGSCFVKDFAAFSKFYTQQLPQDSSGQAILNWLEQKNIELMKSTNKDLDLLKEVYGE